MDEDVLRVGLIGAGQWGQLHAKIYNKRRDVRMVAVADTNVERAKMLAHDHGGQIDVYEDYRDLIRNSSVDAVSVVVPDSLHRAVIMDAVQNGKHVLIEKPLTTDLSEARLCVDAMRKGQKTYMVNFHLRWALPFYHAHKLIQDGVIGEPCFASFEHSNTNHFATDILPWADRSNVLWFLGVHSIDMLQWLFGRRVDRVFCVSEKRLLLQKGVDTPDYFASTLQFEGGGSALLENSWILPKSHPSIARCRCKVIGTEGSMDIDLVNNKSLTYAPNDSGPVDVNGFATTLMDDSYVGAPAFAIAHFVQSALSGNSPDVSLEDALSTVAVVTALLDSVSTAKQKRVEL